MKLLIIEDEQRIALAIKKGLEQEAYVVDVAHDGEKGYDLAATGDYTVIILDLMLPKLDGITLCRKLRTEEKIHTPILMLTAKGDIESKVSGLNTGADDYLAKPFAFAELLARVRALARRPRKAIEQVLALDDLTLNTITYDVRRSKMSIALSKKEFVLLEYLLRHRGTVLSKEQIMNSVWSYNADILPNTVEVYMGYLRNKIDRAFPKSKPLIRTVRGFGYKLAEN
ncbi:MAG TPA: response regulator transcription factor [Patescibacteria group bacterium]|nr:response regulator transcription factor [Patescibacteria group bacterium]